MIFIYFSLTEDKLDAQIIDRVRFPISFDSVWRIAEGVEIILRLEIKRRRVLARGHFAAPAFESSTTTPNSLSSIKFSKWLSRWTSFCPRLIRSFS